MVGQFKLELVFKKETSGTYVYEQADKIEPAKIPTLYIRKSSLPTPPPMIITVEVKW